MAVHSKTWKKKLAAAAREFFLPQRTFEELVASITGVPIIKVYNIDHIPIMGNPDKRMMGRRDESVTLAFQDSSDAQRICEILNQHLLDAAVAHNSHQYFYGAFSSVNSEPCIVFRRADGQDFFLEELRSHLQTVQNHFDKMGRASIAEQSKLLKSFSSGNADFGSTHYLTCGPIGDGIPLPSGVGAHYFTLGAASGGASSEPSSCSQTANPNDKYTLIQWSYVPARGGLVASVSEGTLQSFAQSGVDTDNLRNLLWDPFEDYRRFPKCGY